MQKLQSVQMLRAVAASAVVVLHAYSLAHPIGDSFARLGAAGVDLFFVISGFVIVTIPKKTAGEFLFDRLWRIYPIWLAMIVPCLLLVGRGMAQANREPDALARLR